MTLLVTRRSALVSGLAVIAAPARAQAWPTRPVRLIVGAGPGGTTDIVARLFAPALAEALGQPVSVENRANTVLGSSAIAGTRPDGGTMILLNNGHAVAAALMRRLPYDAVADFAPVAVVAVGPTVILTAPGGRHATLPALLDAARARPESLNLATVGTGTTQYFVAVALEAAAGVRFTQVQYRTTPAALIALRNGEVDAVVETASAVLGQLRDGEARAVAVGGAERSEILPNVPTVAESGLRGFDLSTWYMLAFATGTPAPILDRARDAAAAALVRADTRRRFLDLGLVPGEGGVAEAGDLLRDSVARMAAIRRDANIPQTE